MTDSFITAAAAANELRKHRRNITPASALMTIRNPTWRNSRNIAWRYGANRELLIDSASLSAALARNAGRGTAGRPAKRNGKEQ